MQKLEKKKLDKKIFHIVCVSILALGLLVSGFSLAYFTSHDTVSNRLKSSEISSEKQTIELLEDDWDNIGNFDASKLQPGMKIEKNPQVRNNSTSAVYIRMKFDIQDSNGETLDNIRYRAILTALYLDSECTQRFATYDNSDVTYNNSDFYYYDGWFYYCTDENQLKPLDASEKSSELFKVLQVPITKGAYNTSNKFDTYFQIVVEAEGIPTDSVENTILTEENMENISKIFEEQKS